MDGRVKKLQREKGFGFIVDSKGKEYFFFRTAIKNALFEDLTEGQDVTFEDSEGPKGPRAEDIFV